jgi:hypothetical protein
MEPEFCATKSENKENTDRKTDVRRLFPTAKNRCNETGNSLKEKYMPSKNSTNINNIMIKVCN